MEKERNRPPKYNAGSTYFLSSVTGLPARVFIDIVYKKARSTEWMYGIYSEANPKRDLVFVSESMLSERVSKHSSKVYKLPEIIDRIDNGYRFCGNYELDMATQRGKEYAKNSNIASVMLYKAINSNGDPIDNCYGLWIKWNDPINEDGKSDDQIKIRIKQVSVEELGFILGSSAINTKIEPREVPQ